MSRNTIIGGSILMYLLFALNASFSARTDGEMQGILFLWGPYFFVFLAFLFTLFPQNDFIDLDKVFKLGAVLGLLILLTHAMAGALLFLVSSGLLLISTKAFHNKDSQGKNELFKRGE